MTYLQFHLVFILPPLALLALGLRRDLPLLGRRARVTLPLLMAVAFLYTTPWDNYLVYRAVWGYPPGRVLGTIGYVPIEEYLFFLLQPWLVGMLFFRLLARAPGASPPPRNPWAVRLLGALPWLLLTGWGVRLLGTVEGTYMGLILAWAPPVLALQWLYMGEQIWRLRGPALRTLIPATLYLWVADRIAIGLGIWHISPELTLGWNPFGLPVEEATFFLVTNVLVVFGSVLFLAPGLPHLNGQGAEADPPRDTNRVDDGPTGSSGTVPDA